MWLTNTAIRRPVFILMVFIALAVMGLVSISKMKVELNPKVDFPYVTITTVYAGAGPREIETLVTKPLEDAVNGINGVKSVSSVSQEGVSIVMIEFKLGTNSDVAAADVREKVDGVRTRIPREALAPTISKFDINARPVIYFGMFGKRPSRQLRFIAEETVANRLARVPGAASVSVVGGDVREIQVQIDKGRLDAYGLTVQQIIGALQAANLNIPAGRIREPRREFALRVFGEFQNLDEIRNVRLTAIDQHGVARTYRLSDVATVSDNVQESTQFARINGKNSLTVVVQKTSDSNTADVCSAARAEIEKLDKELPRDIEFVTTFDQSKFILENLADLQMALTLAIILAVLVVYIFLHNIRGTLIVSLAIPTSFVSTFIIINAMGFTLNTMTMLGLSLAVGILVDDSIVVLENIFRHLSLGEQPAEAALNGRSEIGLAAIAITMVDVVVFVPIAFMGGIVGQFFRAFGITVATATLFSLLVSFTLTPMLASRWFRAGEHADAGNDRFSRGFERAYLALDRWYRGVLRHALERRWMVVTIGNTLLIAIFLLIFGSLAGPSFVTAALSFGATVAAFSVLFFLISALWKRHRVPLIRAGFSTIGVGAVLAAVGAAGSFMPELLPFGFFPVQDQGSVKISVEMPAGTSLAATDRVMRRIEKIIETTPTVRDEIEYVTTSVGSQTGSSYVGGSGSQYGEIAITLVEKQALIDGITGWFKFGKHKEHLRTRRDVEIVSEMRSRIGQIPGAKIIVNAESSGAGGGGAPIQLEFSGPNSAQLSKVTARVKTILAGIPGIVDPDLSWKLGKPELQVSVDPEKAALVGLSVAQVASALRTQVQGNTDTKYRDAGKEYDIRVQLTEAQRDNLQQVENLVVGYVATRPVLLRDVATVRMTAGPTKIDRKNRERMVTVTAYLLDGYSTGNMQRPIEEALAKAQIPPPGIRMNWEGENQLMAEEGRYMGQALMLAIVLVYILMAALFESLLMPLTIMLSLPMAMVGALIALIVGGSALNIVAMIGIIMLMGLVTKNAILMVDYTNTLRGRGHDRTAAILEAGPTRLRPILMTTFAMVMGTLPTALALGRGSEFRAPLGIAVIGGLLLSTLLTLLVVPCVYTIFDDLTNWLGGLGKRKRQSRTV